MKRIRACPAKWQKDAPCPRFSQFDGIGNRTAAEVGGNHAGSDLAEISYTPTSLNQYVTHTTPSEFWITGESRADTQVFVSGNESELAYILSLARFSDGEGSLSYGNFLYDLKAFLGAGKFDRSLKSLPEKQQRSVEIDMRSAEEMRRSIKANT